MYIGLGIEYCALSRQLRGGHRQWRLQYALLHPRSELLVWSFLLDSVVVLEDLKKRLNLLTLSVNPSRSSRILILGAGATKL